jgi:L-ascorbate metabolism protein UlaG (beta-lactamase superfamily)
MTRSSPAGPDASIKVTFLGHATALIEIGGTRVLTDPFLRRALGPLQRHGPLPHPADLEVDVVLVSHGHRDHFDRRSLEALPGKPAIVLPRGLAQSLRGPDRAAGPLVELEAGGSVEVGGLRIEAVHARHWISPGADRAQPIGFVLDAAARVYFAGDTGRYAGMGSAVGRVDLALLPIWTWGPHLGPGHLGPRSAAEVTQEIAPAAVIPIHWGTLYPRQLHRVWQRPLRDPGERFAAYVRQLSPRVDVRVLRPGDATTFDLR